ncbi:MAG: hypothetical protein OXI52_09040 [Caldilineaceae bacterium]|nr:hypothetical protein [Caldilineaceae bacterium]
MLQIASGKFFGEKPGRQNELRGVLHTNLILSEHVHSTIKTVAGRLLPVGTLRNPNSLVYEITERIEYGEVVPGNLVSHTIEPYMEDFAAIVSFALNVICTPNYELAARLVGTRSGIQTESTPSLHMRRVFDSQVWCQSEDAAHLVQFVDDLIALERKYYLAAMRAIRTYVNGLHRLADDLALAYTLMVASIESLAHDFDGHRAKWEDYEDKKRKTIDKALACSDEKTAARVRDAVLENEHVALSRRFRDFAIDHIAPSFFRKGADAKDHPIREADLLGALKEAYSTRSRYIHSLREPPPTLSLGIGDYSETRSIDRVTILTFQGLARLTRCVITEFIRRQPKVETESYDYGRDRHGIIQIPLTDFAPQYWIHQVDELTVDSGRLRLEGFLNQIVSYLRQEDNASVTDIREMLSESVRKFPNMNQDQRRPFLALHVLFNKLVTPDLQMNTKIARKYMAEFEDPSSEAMLVKLLSNEIPNWTLDEHEKVYREYLRSQGKKNGLKAPPSLVAGCALEIAERFRVSGDLESAQELITSAVENYPGHEPLYTFESTFDPEKPINWREVVFTADGGTTDEKQPALQ